MQKEVIFAGFGGQGIMSAAKILALAAMEQDAEVSWIPSYGPEMRGGTAYCTVIVSDEPIGSPIVRNPASLVAMNQPSLEKFAPAVQPGGVILINSSLIPVTSGRGDVDEMAIPVYGIAEEIGSVRAASIVALGAFAAKSGIVAFENLEKAVKKTFAAKAKLIPLNIRALDAGRRASA